MAFDGLVAYHVAKELETHLLGGKIDKIFEPNPNEIILGVYSNGMKYALDMVTSSQYYRMCLTTSSKPNPTYAPNFCMVLRKHLLNTRITKISTFSLERIITIEFEGRSKVDDNETKKLVIELMGKHSNIILLRPNNVIIDALKHFRIEENSYRNIIPNAMYTFPISNKLNFMEIQNTDDFYKTTIAYMKNHFPSQLLDKKSPESFELKALSEILSSVYTGFSKSFIVSLLHHLQMEDVFSESHMSQVYDYINKMLAHPYHTIAYYFSDTDYSLKISSADREISLKENDLQINFFLDDYYTKKENVENFSHYQNNLSRLILNVLKKLNQKLSHINDKLKDCQNAEIYQLYGELITNNLYRIPKHNIEKIEIENYYDNNKIIVIPLDKSISPSLNAKKFFKKYRKLKNAKQIVELQKQEVELEIQYLESIIYEFENATTVSDIDTIYQEFSESFLKDSYYYKKQNQKKQLKTSKKNTSSVKVGNPIECQIDGFNVLIGKNNKQNDYITKHAKPDDLWFHAKDIHGSHVILKAESKSPSQETINKVAALAASHSKAGSSSNVPVDYTFIKYVKKPSKAKPGMVIYTNHKNVIVKPLKNGQV